MGVEHEQANIDKQQKRIDLFDNKEDKKISDKTPNIVFTRLDDFQKTIRESKEPEAVKAKQLKELGDLLGAAKIEGLDHLDKDLEAKIQTFEAGLGQFENKELHQVKSGETLGSIVKEKLHVDIGSNPKLFFAGIKALQEYRTTHGSILKISGDATITWDKGNASPDQREIGEYLDLNVLNGLPSGDNAGIDFYIEHTSNQSLKNAITKLRDTIKTPDVAAEVKAIAAKLPKPGTKPEEVEQLIDSHLMEEFSNVDTETMGFGKIKTRDEFNKMMDGITTDAQMKEFLASITDGLQAQQEAELKATEQQKMRLEQVGLISQALMGMSELLKDSGGVAAKSMRFLMGAEKRAAMAQQYADLAQEFSINNSRRIMLEPEKSLEQQRPELVQMFRHAGDGALSWISRIPAIDFKDPQNEGDVNLQRAQVMSFLMEVGEYQTVGKIGEGALKDEFDTAKREIPPNKRKEISKAAVDKMAGNKARYEEQWKAQGLTDTQITDFMMQMEMEAVDKDLTSYALLNNFDAKSLSPDKKAVWDVYNNTFDPQNEWGNMSEDHWDIIVEEVLINAPLIILSGGAASLARAGLSVAARAFLASSTLARFTALGASTVAAYDAGTIALDASIAARTIDGGLTLGNMAIKGTAMAGSTLFEGATFEATHNALAVQLGLEDQYLLEMPDAMQKILWSSVSLGAFHVAGAAAEGIGKTLDEGLAKQVMRNHGVANPEEFKSVIASEALKISNLPTRKVIQQLVISGNIEAATMLTIGAVQEGYYNGNLQNFKDNFGEELFHAYVSVGSLKAGGHLSETLMEGMRGETKVAAEGVAPKLRLAKAGEVLGRELSPEQQSAILKLHKLMTSWREANGKITEAQRLEMETIFNEAGFTQEEKGTLLRSGIIFEFKSEAGPKSDAQKLEVEISEVESKMDDISKLSDIELNEMLENSLVIRDKLSTLEENNEVNILYNVNRQIYQALSYEMRLRQEPEGNFDARSRFAEIKKMPDGIEKDAAYKECKEKLNAQSELAANLVNNVRQYVSSHPNATDTEVFEYAFVGDSGLTTPSKEKMRIAPMNQYFSENPKSTYTEAMDYVCDSSRWSLNFSREQRVRIKDAIRDYIGKNNTVRRYAEEYKGNPKELVAKIFDKKVDELHGEITMEVHGATLFFNCSDSTTYHLLHGTESLLKSAGFATQQSSIPELAGTITVGNNAPDYFIKELIAHEQRHQENAILSPKLLRSRPIIRAADEIIAYMRDGSSADRIKRTLTDKDGLYNYFESQRAAAISEYANSDTPDTDALKTELSKIDAQWAKHCAEVNRLVDIAFSLGRNNLDLMSINPPSKWGKLAVTEWNGVRTVKIENVIEANNEYFDEQLAAASQISASLKDSYREGEIAQPEYTSKLHEQMSAVLDVIREYTAKFTMMIGIDFDLASAVENKLGELKELYRKMLGAYRDAGGKEESVDENEESKKVAGVKPSAEQLKINSSLEPEDRLTKASELLERELSPDQKRAILKAHEVGANGEGKFTKTELLQKARILVEAGSTKAEAGFTKKEIRTLMENGITGVKNRIVTYTYFPETSPEDYAETLTSRRKTLDDFFGKPAVSYDKVKDMMPDDLWRAEKDCTELLSQVDDNLLNSIENNPNQNLEPILNKLDLLAHHYGAMADAFHIGRIQLQIKAFSTQSDRSDLVPTIERITSELWRDNDTVNSTIDRMGSIKQKSWSLTQQKQNLSNIHGRNPAIDSMSIEEAAEAKIGYQGTLNKLRQNQFSLDELYVRNKGDLALKIDAIRKSRKATSRWGSSWGSPKKMSTEESALPRIDETSALAQIKDEMTTDLKTQIDALDKQIEIKKLEQEIAKLKAKN